MKVLELIKVYNGPIYIIEKPVGSYESPQKSKKLSSIYYDYTVDRMWIFQGVLYCSLKDFRKNITVDDALKVSGEKEVVLITLPYKGEESAFLSSDIPPEYLSRDISVLIEHEDLNIIIMEI